MPGRKEIVALSESTSAELPLANEEPKIGMINNYFSQQEWSKNMSLFHDSNLIQTWAYGDLKATRKFWNVVRFLFFEKDTLVGMCQCIVFRVPYIGGIVWINRGPLWRRTENEEIHNLKEMLNILKHYWVQSRGMYLLVAPTVYAHEFDEVKFAQQQFHMVKDSADWSSAKINLSLSHENIRKNLQQKWRNCLHKAERSDIAYESGIHDSLFYQVLDEYETMMKKKRLEGVMSSLMLDSLQKTLSNDEKLWGLVAWKGKQRLGGVLIARYGNTVEYLVGAFNEDGRQANAGNFLLWKAISEMKQLGYLWFDLGGMHPLNTPKGIFHFKSGVNAAPYRYCKQLESYNNSIRQRLIGHAIRRKIATNHSSNQDAVC
jgi:lipid II:glycine glycyltransferase (peptidoglycan interpeptide bridge formation enzyme)